MLGIIVPEDKAIPLKYDGKKITLIGLSDSDLTIKVMYWGKFLL